MTSPAASLLKEWELRAANDPGDREAWLNVARLRHSLWDIAGSRQAFEEVVRIDPRCPEARGLLLYFTHFDDAWTPARRHQMHRDWWRLFGAEPRTRFPNSRDPRRRLRVGYVANAFQRRPESLFLLPILDNHDDRAVEVFCYSGTPGERSERHTWRDVSQHSASALAQQLLSDGIDIAIDISGPLDHRAAEAFAARCAPVQVSFPNYAGSTGLETMDYRITDRFADPEGISEHLYTERLCRLPVLLPYAPPRRCPEVEDAPYRRNGFVTFGCFNNPIKLTPELLRIWAEILARANRARLVIHHALGGLFETKAGAVDPDLRARLAAPFLSRGIEEERVAFAGGLCHWDHLDFHNEIDLMLDSFPCNGFTTTVESMWMGVPVLAWEGQSYVSRISAAFLKHCGQQAFVADSVEDYVERAVGLAHQPDALAQVRRELRDRMRASALLDGAGYTRQLECSLAECWLARLSSWSN